MANTITTTTLIDGSKRRVIHVHISGDGSGDESNTVIYDHSGDTTAGTAGKYKIHRVWSNLGPFSIEIFFDGGTDFEAVHLDGNDNGLLDFTVFGGIPDKSVTPTGDVTFSTVGLGASEEGFFIVDLIKS